MPRANRPPSYRLHKARQCAVVTIRGKDHYLGPYGSPESHEKYARLIARANAAGPDTSPPDLRPSTSGGPLTVNAIILPYLEFASVYYRKNGQPTGEIDNIRCSLASLKSVSEEALWSNSGPRIWSEGS